MEIKIRRTPKKHFQKKRAAFPPVSAIQKQGETQTGHPKKQQDKKQDNKILVKQILGEK